MEPLPYTMQVLCDWNRCTMQALYEAHQGAMWALCDLHLCTMQALCE